MELRRSSAARGATMVRIFDDTGARRELAELHAIARHLMRGERKDHTLQPTALVHEAWLRLAGRDDAGSLSRERFLAAAATTMRRILVDAARRRATLRRGAGLRRSLDTEGDSPGSAPIAPTRDAELLALDDALAALASADAQLAQLVDLRVFGGLDVESTARALGVSARTVKRRWCFARGWLAREIRERLA